MYVYAWNYNKNRNNMQENLWLYARLSFQVVYFEVMLNI